MRFYILGGGCYGTFYAQQLIKARAAGVAVDAITVVDRNETPKARRDIDDESIVFVRTNWDDFFDDFLASRDTRDEDQLVPSPFNPHLGLAWLMRSLRQSCPQARLDLENFSQLPTIAYREQREHGTLVASHAAWICPVHCVEPATCPKTRGPRSWDMHDTALALGRQLGSTGQPVDLVELFHCHHVTYGVGAYPAGELRRAQREVLERVEASPVVRCLVGTVSRCHGALHLLAVRTGTDTVSPA